MLFTTRESHLSSSACYIKTPTLLPSLYCCGSNLLPLRSLLRKVDYIEKVAKWAMILEAFDIKYMPHTSVKG